MNIKDLIGETTEYDKKLELETKKPKSWCKSVSAFANCFGGKLIYGVANDGTLVGLEDAELVSEKISEIIKERLNPIPEFKLSFKTDEGMRFVIVDVYPGRRHHTIILRMDSLPHLSELEMRVYLRHLRSFVSWF